MISRSAVLEVAASASSPAKAALIALEYVPALRPTRLTLLSVASPLMSVSAEPSDCPGNKTNPAPPTTGGAPARSVGKRVIAPPYVPVTNDAESVVEALDV